MFHAMFCYDFAMFRIAGGQRRGTGHGRAKQLERAASFSFILRRVADGINQELVSRKRMTLVQCVTRKIIGRPQAPTASANGLQRLVLKPV